MYDRHQSGKASEFYVAYELTCQGFDIYFPTGNPRYDLIAEKDGERYFIQVKSGIRRDDEIKINLRGNSTIKRYTKQDVDLIVIHERTNNDVMYLPIKDVEGQISVCLRYEAPKKIHSHRTRMVSDYLTLPSEIGNRLDFESEAI